MDTRLILDAYLKKGYNPLLKNDYINQSYNTVIDPIRCVFEYHLVQEYDKTNTGNLNIEYILNNYDIPTESLNNLLYDACGYKNYEVAKMILNYKDIDVNYKQEYVEGKPLTALNFLIFCSYDCLLTTEQRQNMILIYNLLIKKGVDYMDGLRYLSELNQIDITELINDNDYELNDDHIPHKIIKLGITYASNE